MEDARAWVRRWRLEGLPQMRALLWETWEPLDLASDDASEDEYDSYTNVLAASSRAAAAARTLPSTWRRPWWRTATSLRAWVARCEQIAQDLLDWYGRSNAPR